MISKATVTKKLEGNLVEIEVMRQSACGDNCANCSGCDKPTNIVKAVAKNEKGAKVGEIVNVKGSAGFVLKGASFVYVMPLILFFVAYSIAATFVDTEGICIAVGTIFFAIGIYFAGRYSKKIEKDNDINLEIM